MKEIKCEIIQDLITLYVDDLTSEESNELIEGHIGSCDECREFLGSIKKNNNLGLSGNKDNFPGIDDEVEEKLVKKIQKSKINFSMILIILTCAISTVLNDGPYIFTGIILLPIIGAISYLKLRNTWIAPVTIYLSNTVVLLVGDFNSMLKSSDSYNYVLERLTSFVQYIFGVAGFGLIFAGFTFVGVIIGILIEKIFIDD